MVTEAQEDYSIIFKREYLAALTNLRRVDLPNLATDFMPQVSLTGKKVLAAMSNKMDEIDIDSFPKEALLKSYSEKLNSYERALMNATEPEKLQN